MKTVEILRRETSNEDGTFGVLSINKKIFCLTLEPPWRDNKKSISCIPAGTYIAKRIMSPSHGDTFRVMNVPNRQYINFHPGNLMEHTEGCILLGESVVKLKSVDRGIANSGKTFKDFMTLMENEQEFNLIIKEFY